VSVTLGLIVLGKRVSVGRCSLQNIIIRNVRIIHLLNTSLFQFNWVPASFNKARSSASEIFDFGIACLRCLSEMKKSFKSGLT